MARKVRKIVKIRTAWAIDANYTDLDAKHYPGFIGRGYFSGLWSDTGDIRQAIFRTRKVARLELPRIKNTFPDARVVKVFIIVKTVNPLPRG